MNRIMKKITAVILVICIPWLGTFNLYADKPCFSDVSGHWAQKYIDKLVNIGAISGFKDGLFHPDIPVTTSQFVSMLLMSRYGKMAPVDDYWASGYLNYAYKNGIITEYDLENKEKPLTRQFAARIGHETLLSAFNEEDEKDWSSADRLEDLYTCHTCVIHIAQFYVKGIMIGRDNRTFGVGDNLTRAQAAVIIMRIIDPSLRNPQIAVPSEDTSEDGIISPDKAKAIMQADKTALLIDVRPEEDHKKGYIPGSICVPIDGIVKDLQQTVIPSQKDTVIIVYCQKGVRSLKAFKILKDAGYTNVYNLGGIDSWPYEVISD